MITPTEREFQTQVVELAKLFGFRIAHFRPAPSAKGWRTPMIGNPGWPDLVLLRPPRLILAELKRTAKDKPDPEQLVWLDQLKKVVGVEVYLWRPEDLDKIVDILRPGVSGGVVPPSGDYIAGERGPETLTRKART